MVGQLVGMLRACGAEKLPGVLEGDPDAADVRQALAFLRARLDEIEIAMARRDQGEEQAPSLTEPARLSIAAAPACHVCGAALNSIDQMYGLVCSLCWEQLR
jgi:hypothetical protein